MPPLSSWLPSPSSSSAKRKPKDTALYDLLGVEYTVNDEELKKAYKKRALRLHPDKGGDPAEFDKMKRAYDVLKDPKKREYYDRYGPKMLAAMEQGGPESAGLMMVLLLSQKRYRLLIMLAVLFMVGLIDLLPVLVSVKWDGAEWSWGLAFFPIFLILGLGFLAQFLACFIREKRGADATAEDDEEAPNRAHLLSVLVLTALQVVFWSFYSAKLDGTVDWSWYLVVIPLAVFELWLMVQRWVEVGLALRTVRQTQERIIKVAQENIQKANASAEEDPEAASFVVLEETDRIRHATEVLKEVRLSKSYMLTSVFWPVLRETTWWLLAAKAQGDLQETWFVTAIPFIVGVALYPCFEATKPVQVEEDGEQAAGGCAVWCSYSCMYCVWLLIWLLGMGKLDNADIYSSFAVFAIWFALSALLLLPLITVACFNPEDLLGGEEETEEKPAAAAAAGESAAAGQQADAVPPVQQEPNNVIILS